jgi:hypothetical protein
MVGRHIAKDPSRPLGGPIYRPHQQGRKLGASQGAIGLERSIGKPTNQTAIGQPFDEQPGPMVGNICECRHGFCLASIWLLSGF